MIHVPIRRYSSSGAVSSGESAAASEFRISDLGRPTPADGSRSSRRPSVGDWRRSRPDGNGSTSRCSSRFAGARSPTGSIANLNLFVFFTGLLLAGGLLALLIERGHIEPE